MIPFATVSVYRRRDGFFNRKGSSSIEKSSSDISEKNGTRNWLSGNRFSGSATDDEIKNWLTGLELE